MALTYNQLMQATGSTAWQHLTDALKTVSSGLGGGISFFGPVLFCLMEREFRAAPNKKKAILLWELFIQGNYGTQVTNVMRPDPYGVNREWLNLSLLEQNLEADFGVPEKTVRETLAAVNTIIQSYNSATQLGMLQRWKTSGQRKFNTLGGGVSPTMFQLYAKHFEPMVEMVNGNSSMDSAAEKLFKFRKKLGDLVKRAEFKPERLGLS